MQFKLKKGFDIRLAGSAEQTAEAYGAPTYALKPTDFVGMKRPKLVVKEGANVKAGTPIFYDVAFPEAQYCSPVSGEVVEVRRGAKRKVLEVVILADKATEYEDFPKHSASELNSLKREECQETMLRSGVWPSIIQRPYGVVANAADTPRDIFISTFSTAPLAPDYGYVYGKQGQYLQAGVDILRKFTSGSVHVNMSSDKEVVAAFNDLQGVEHHKFSGKHPAGNVGVQIHHIAPINKEEVVWTLHPNAVADIGRLFLEGKYNPVRTIAFQGSEVAKPRYIETRLGAGLEKLVAGGLKQEHVRVISGNPLSGEKVEKKGFVGFYDDQICVLPEGDRARFILTEGWLAPVANRVSFHRAFGLLSFLNPKSKEYRLDTSLNGEERAFVATGTFEQVLPMDIYPMHLIKAIMAEDYDEMEALGIHEVIEEDFALCEFIDVSKHDIQGIIRHGLDLMRIG
jgi:Na+-transporting NADH:ubiquinone oxidoreductase subunit A